MSTATRPSSRRCQHADFYGRILEVASANLGAEAGFAGSRDWIMLLFRESYPNDCLATADRRLLANFVQRAACHGVSRGLIAPRRSPTDN